MPSASWNIGYIPHKHAQMHPEKTAIVFEDEPYSYGRLNEGINKCAHMLQAKGLKKGDRVCVLLHNCIGFLEIYFASALLGAVLVPLNLRLKVPELEYQINDSGACFLFFHDSFLGCIDLIRNKLKVEHDKFIFLKNGGPQLPGFELPQCPDWAEEYIGLITDKSNSSPDNVESVLMKDPLAIVYTSGVTGNPRGVVLSHGQTFFKAFQIGMYLDSSASDILIAQMPLLHSGGLFIVVTPALNAGMTLVMRRWFDANEFAEDIQRYRGTIVFAHTAMWRMIIESGKLDIIDVSSVRCVLGGGEKTPVGMFDELAKRGLHMQHGYGQTENSAMMLLSKEDVYRKMGSIGKPGYFTDIWIEDTSGRRLPPGEIGEIVATGPTVMSGYWNSPEKTRETIVNGLLHTGDLGYIDEEGYFYFVDRAKDMFCCGGEKVYPAEVEKILLNHPKVSQVAIIGINDDKLGEVGLAVVVPNEADQVITLEEVRTFLTNKVSKYMHPTYVMMMKELPLTATLKVKKTVLKEKFSGSQK
jgi:fatty-acyl-CoA synthase